MFINDLFDMYNKIYQLFFASKEDSVTTNWTSKTMLSNPIEITYVYDGKRYTTPMYLPKLSKDQQVTILSAELNGVDTDYIFTCAGPYHNFFMNPVLVGDIVNCSKIDFVDLSVMVFMDGELLTFTYTNYDEPVMFHYGVVWGDYLPVERTLVKNRLDYLCLDE